MFFLRLFSLCFLRLCEKPFFLMYILGENNREKGYAQIRHSYCRSIDAIVFLPPGRMQPSG
jgi:hypothetical protein